MEKSNNTPLYGRKKGRIRKSKADLLISLLPKLELKLPLEEAFLATLVDSKKPLFVEIGYGSGDHLIAQMKMHPEAVFLGCEPFLGGIANFLKKFQENEIPFSSIKLFTKDGQSLLKALPDESIDALFLLFPDPWPKKRHHRRRFFQRETLQEIKRCLKEGGRFIFSSDWSEYFDEVEALIRKDSDLKISQKDTLPHFQDFKIRPPAWPMTQFERKAHQAGRECAFLILQKIKNPGT